MNLLAMEAEDKIASYFAATIDAYMVCFTLYNSALHGVTHVFLKPFVNGLYFECFWLSKIYPGLRLSDGVVNDKI